MKIYTRDDTEHDVEYVTRADAEREIQWWKQYATDACTTLRCERDELKRQLREEQCLHVTTLNERDAMKEELDFMALTAFHAARAVELRDAMKQENAKSQ